MPQCRPQVCILQYNAWYNRFCLWLLQKLHAALTVCALHCLSALNHQKGGQFEILCTSDKCKGLNECFKFWNQLYQDDISWCALRRVCVCYVICFGVQNECFYTICNMPWCAKRMFVCTMKYALVCRMNVCMCQACFLCWHELAKTTCPNFVTCLNCNWKWAFVLTLLNTKAQKCYPCILHHLLPFI